MSTTINYTLRLDEDDKQQAEQVFNQLGLTLAAGLTVYLKAVVRQQRIPFDLSLNKPPLFSTVGAKHTSRTQKEKSFNALAGILAGHEVNLDQEREERIMSN